MTGDLNILLIGFLLQGEFFYIPRGPITIQVTKGIQAVTWPHWCQLSSSWFVFNVPGALCGQFEVTVPKSIEVLHGSCLTIPCSFDVLDTYYSHLNEACTALWKSNLDTVFDSSNPQTTGHLIGNLKNRDCTTTLNNMQSQHSKTYFFRLECDSGPKYNFKNRILDISVKGRF